ncbi:gamma-glutamylcyclotransferase family protein [Mucilaginibacter agri]|uniref:Gamma-glutamylcyclotransferase n=1 Tax=Mucilaginibacter agri TaxID=2695265 RepID=A0A965ZKQ5_9SPHI|nr:gamma-glutamylcyclotransferase family protein [Mucilaginibacter agri]NCD72470.1 gamma-glutamylcyclotransferase [Mucilaginibacter agri]
MFLYFGYGSNINLVSLRAKGVEPISSQRAVLWGWCLRFNVQHWFRHEGGVGNIEQTNNPDDFVEGVVHTCHDEHLASLDAIESYGLGYDRIVVEPETINGLVSAQTYVGLPAFLDDSCLPTRRYLNIVIKGAEAAGLSEHYIEKLRSRPVQPEKDYPDFERPGTNDLHFNRQTLALKPQFTALAGAVFDMGNARDKHKGLIPLFGGKDMTLFYVKRHDTSDGNETLEDIANGSISDEVKRYLNAYLNEYAKEYLYVGSYDYK